MGPSAPANTSASKAQLIVNPTARVLLAGVYLASSSPLRILRTCPDVVKCIFIQVQKAWKSTLILGYDDDIITSTGNLAHHPSSSSDEFPRPTSEDLSRLALCRVNSGNIVFPPPRDLYCNMLPFRRDDLSTIPLEYHGYLPIIRCCHAVSSSAISYLTIHESHVDEFVPQRRAGIHVEGFLATAAVCKKAAWWHHWGRSLGGPWLEGGIFHASSVASSCKMWNVQIPREPSDVLQLGCDLEHLRGVLNQVAKPIIPKRNELYWMTDATPHESLPLQPGTYRQYFRLVIGPISAWWSKHSTPNRLGVQPDCRILIHSKFEEGALVDYDQLQTHAFV